MLKHSERNFVSKKRYLFLKNIAFHLSINSTISLGVHSKMLHNFSKVARVIF